MILGKTNVPELMIAPFTESPTFGVTRNPWDRPAHPGGSSGGSRGRGRRRARAAPRSAPTAPARSASPPPAAGCSASRRSAAGSRRRPTSSRGTGCRRRAADAAGSPTPRASRRHQGRRAVVRRRGERAPGRLRIAVSVGRPPATRRPAPTPSSAARVRATSPRCCATSATRSSSASSTTAWRWSPRARALPARDRRQRPRARRTPSGCRAARAGSRGSAARSRSRSSSARRPPRPPTRRAHRTRSSTTPTCVLTPMFTRRPPRSASYEGASRRPDPQRLDRAASPTAAPIQPHRQPAVSVPPGFTPDGFPLAVQLVGPPGTRRRCSRSPPSSRPSLPWADARPDAGELRALAEAIAARGGRQLPRSLRAEPRDRTKSSRPTSSPRPTTPPSG